MATIKRRTVLFADLRGSTALYESLGNARASSLVNELMRPLVHCIPAQGGQLVKTLGDGLMAVFPTPREAVLAAHQMQEALEQLPPTDDGNEPAVRPQLQVAVTAGEVVEVGGDCFGDAVNVAARLLEHAGDGETLISREAHEALTADQRGRFRRLERLQLRGRSEPVEVFQLQRRTGPDTQVTELDEFSATPEPQGIELVWRGGVHRFHRDDLPILLGRSSSSSLVIQEARVSRTHARIDLQGGAFQVTDVSINGTFVRFAGDEELLSLRRGACTLHGQGEIGLGGSPNDPATPVLHFTLLLEAPDRYQPLPRMF